MPASTRHRAARRRCMIQSIWAAGDQGRTQGMLEATGHAAMTLVNFLKNVNEDNLAGPTFITMDEDVIGRHHHESTACEILLALLHQAIAVVPAS
jgi:hypothetical protein